MQKKKIGLLGYGNFGRFMANHLRNYFDVFVYSPNYIDSVPLEDIASCDYIILAITLNNFEQVCIELSALVRDSTVIIDVCSVKVLPISIMKKYFPNNPILGTHPIFGPQSGANGIDGLPIVLANVSVNDKEYSTIKNFLSETLKLNTIETTADQHDQEMAYIQGLSHFIGRALSIMNIQEYKTATKSYKQLISLEHLVGGDSLDLYKTIQRYNPYTKKVREEFLETLAGLQEMIKE